MTLAQETELRPLETFCFACNETVPCFTRCCHDADLLLYPYDIIRLKQNLRITSEEFLVAHTVTAFRENPNFPSVMLKMSDKTGRPCPFLSETGCTVYPDRPYSCRAYPLAPAIYGDPVLGTRLKCFLVRHDHCKGHGRGREWTYDQLMEDQGMNAFHPFNSAWAKVAHLLHTRPFPGPPGPDNPAMNMAYMASYNMDTFRRFVFGSSFLARFEIPGDRLEQAKEDDATLLLLGLDWIMKFVAGQGPLRERPKT